MNRIVRHLRPFVAAIIAAGACQSMALAEDAPLLPVSVTHPLTEHITTWDEYSGRFVAVKSVEVRPRVSGFIDKVNFIDGAVVKAGDLLFTIDQRPFAIAVESAKAEVARAAAQVKVDGRRRGARQAAGRARMPSRAATSISGRPASPSPRRSCRSAQAAEKAAQLNLEWTEVRAPIAGRISDKKVNEGNLVNGGSGSTTLLGDDRVARSHPVRVRGVGERLSALHARQSVRCAALLARRQQSRAHPARRREGVDARRQDGFRRQPARRAHRAPSAAAPSSTTRTCCSRRACSAASSFSPATSTPS